MKPTHRRSAEIVLVNFHCEEDVSARVEQLGAAGFATTVVDNSGSYRHAPPDRILRPSRNVGFGAAVNAAATTSSADVLVLHNPDATSDVVVVDALLARLASQANPGAVAPLIILASGASVVGFRRPSVAREVLTTPMRIGALRTIGSTRPRRSGGSAPAVDPSNRFGSAALMVVDRRAFLAVGGFDERLFMYAEDLVLWTELERCGYSVELAPDLRVEHAAATGSPMRAGDRELLRWIGVEYWLSRSGQRPSPVLRTAHRALVRFLPGSKGLQDAVTARWRDGQTPSEVLDSLRPGLEQGALVDGKTQPIQRLGWSRTRVAIAPDALVLDVGAGAFPSARADVCCDRSLGEDQHRNERLAVVDRPFVLADSLALPFRDGAFDFVIASHLAEHVSDPSKLVDELRRVASSGYVETPSPFGDALLPEKYHLWRVSHRGSTLRFRSRSHVGRLAGRLGEQFYFLYNAGRGTGKQTAELPPGMVGTLVGLALFAVRGVMNRSGVMHTRVVWSAERPLRAEVDALALARSKHDS